MKRFNLKKLMMLMKIMKININLLKIDKFLFFIYYLLLNY